MRQNYASPLPLDCFSWLICLIRIRQAENLNDPSCDGDYANLEDSPYHGKYAKTMKNGLSASGDSDKVGSKSSLKQASIKLDARKDKKLIPFTHLPGVTDRLANIIVVCFLNANVVLSISNKINNS